MSMPSRAAIRRALTSRRLVMSCTAWRACRTISGGALAGVPLSNGGSGHTPYTAPKLRFSTLERDLIRLRSPSDRRDGRLRRYMMLPKFERRLNVLGKPHSVIAVGGKTRRQSDNGPNSSRESISKSRVIAQLPSAQPILPQGAPGLAALSETAQPEKPAHRLAGVRDTDGALSPAKSRHHAHITHARIWRGATLRKSRAARRIRKAKPNG